MYKIKRFSQMTEEERQYTRAEKEAFLELYRATKGLRSLPTSSNARDVHRFNKFATDLKKMSLGDSKGFDRENAKQLLENVGLHKNAAQVDKMIDKYTNKRALARLSRLKSHKGNKIDYDAGEQMRIKANKIMGKSADAHNDAHHAFDKSHVVYSPDENVIDKLTNYAKKKNIDVVRSSNHPEFQGKYDSFVETRPDMGRVIVGKDGNKYIGQIVQNTNALESDLAHEIGHVKTYLSDTGKELKKARTEDTVKELKRRNRGKAYIDDKLDAFQKLADNVVTRANENSATSYGNALLKKMGVGEKQLARNKKVAEVAGDTYQSAAVNKTADALYHSTKWA